MKKNRYVLVESNEPDTLLRFGVEVYKDKETNRLDHIGLELMKIELKE
jgi:hypothetical protein